jgi:cell division protein ZapE
LRALHAAGMTPMQRYLAELARGELQPDAAQLRAVEYTQRLYDRLVGQQQPRSRLLRRIRFWAGPAQAPPTRGLYLWGGVGRGKTHIVNEFHAALPFSEKLRVHFHSFMQLVHQKLRALGGRQDPLAAVAEALAGDARIVCFDEFHVSDIADAMILGRFLWQVMDRGVQFVMTSNYRPDQLYPNGLQRERFLPAIELIKSRLDVLEVDNGTDYRRLKMEKLKVYHVGPEAETTLARAYDELKDVEDEDHPLDVEGRIIRYRRRAGGVVWFDFAILCGGPRSYADYVDLARRFHTIFLSDVPRLSAKNADAARRFTWLIDVLYDDRVNLVVAAEAQPEELFVEGTHSAEFARTVSRLHEMQSLDYLRSERARH